MSYHHLGVVVAGGLWLYWSLVLFGVRLHMSPYAQFEHVEPVFHGYPERGGYLLVAVVVNAGVVPRLAEEEVLRTDWVVAGRCFCAYGPACFDPLPKAYPRVVFSGLGVPLGPIPGDWGVCFVHTGRVAAEEPWSGRQG